MKKRLLSAALALAMVLTLLPLSAFAADTPPDSSSIGTSGKTSVTYQSANNSTQGITEGPGYYYKYETTDSDGKKESHWKLLEEDGVIYSGKFYAADDFTTDAGKLVGTSFTVVGDVELALPDDTTSLNVDIYGGTLTLTGNGPKLTGLTVNDTKWSQEQYISSRTKGELDFDVTRAADNDEKTGLTIKADNVKLGTFELKNAASRTITLNNCEVTAITLAGKSDNSQSQNLTINNSYVTGKIDVTGNSSRVTLKDVTKDGSAATGGVDLTGTGASLTVQGSSNIGDVSLETAVDDAKKKTAAGLTLDVQGGKVGAVTGNSGEVTTAYTIKVGVNGEATSIATTNIKDANVTISSGKCGAITLPNGKLTVEGSYAKVTDAVQLGNGSTTEVSLSITGTHHTFSAAITGTDGTTYNSVSVSDSDTNTYHSIALAGYTGKGVKGGTYTDAAPDADHLDKSIKFTLDDGAGKISLYLASNLGDALTAQAKTTGTLSTKNAPTKDPVVVTFTNGTDKDGKDVELGTLNMAPYEKVVLPTLIDGRTYGTWWDDDKDWPAGKEYSAPASGPVSLDAKGNGNTVTKIEKVTAKVGGSQVYLKVDLNSNQISLSGAMEDSGAITLELTTDMSADPIAVDAYYDADDNTLVWANQSMAGKGGMSLVIDSATAELKLQLSNKTEYTVKNAGLKVPSKECKVDKEGKKIVVESVSGNANATPGIKAAVVDMISGTSSEFAWEDVPAMELALNLARAGITDSTVKSWREKAQREAFTYYDKGTYTAKTDGPKTDYTEVYLVPYLGVSVTDYKPNGTITMTLTPKYRVEVRQPDKTSATKWTLPDNDKYPGSAVIVDSGKSLGTLTGEMKTDGGNALKVTFNSLGTTTGPFLYMHQDGTYVYKCTTNNEWEFTHAGKTGLGTVTINATEPLVTLYDSDEAKADVKGYYNTIQAAVDDTEPTGTGEKDDYIVVEQGYGDTTVPISVTGYARTFSIRTIGNTKISSATSGGVLIDPDETGHLYTVKLNKDTAPVGGNITIASSDGGTASVNANPATAGSKVTITLSASAGYTASGVSVKTASGATVSVSGSGNSYTFTMPSGSVTVTPSFSRTNTNATVSVGTPSTGTGTATTNTSGQVAPGTLVTVTTNPGAGQRTMGLTVTGATAVRTGTNTFQFSVPSGYSTVTVTPKFDANNGTLYEDVWSTEYYSNPVRWAVERGITNGQSTYRFGTGYNCTREDMVTFLWRAAGSPTMSNVSNPFWDVQAGSYYYNAVLWAVSKGITNGVTANQFGVGQPVTRAQTVTFLYRYNNSPAASTNSGFYDVNSREYYAKAVSWANAKGVTNGTTATTFSPNNYCPREQIVTFLYRDITGNRA